VVALFGKNKEIAGNPVIVFLAEVMFAMVSNAKARLLGFLYQIVGVMSIAT
jgi:hypothetical protein